MKKWFALLLLLVLLALLVAQPKHNSQQESPTYTPITAINTAPTLAERLGFKATDKILIINGDDVGMSHGANAATINALENGLMTSATVMVPCSWFPEIVAYAKAHPKADFGLHLTFTSEWETYRWGPVASKSDIPGLIDPQSYLWPDAASVYKHATPAQAEIEARAQIKKALAAGIDVTHLDSHMAVLQLDKQYFQVYRKLAKEFDLPLRVSSQELLARGGAGYQRGQLNADGIVYPDYLISSTFRQGEPMADYWKRMLRNLKPGVTELIIHAALPTEEMQHITKSAKLITLQDRVTEYHLFTSDPEIRQILHTQGVKRIGYRALRDLQRTHAANRQRQ